MNRAEKAVSDMKSGLCCSQSVLRAFSDDLGLDEEMAARLAAGFGGGMGRMAGTCGAVTGAYMVLGLGCDGEMVREGRPKVYEAVREFSRRFTARNNSMVCKDLMGVDISTPEGLAAANSQGLFPKICPRMVQDAVEILETMLAERKARG